MTLISTMSLMLNVALTVWILFDARTRKNNFAIWFVLMLILGFLIILPVYFARRNLKSGEIREGGFAWNIIRNYTLSFTGFMSLAMVTVLLEGQGGTLPFLIILWLFITFTMLIIGLFVKQSKAIERGLEETHL